MLNEILVRIVSSCGYQTVSAFDGAQAVAVMMQTRVDMVLMDVRRLVLAAPLRLTSSRCACRTYEPTSPCLGDYRQQLTSHLSTG